MDSRGCVTSEHHSFHVVYIIVCPNSSHYKGSVSLSDSIVILSFRIYQLCHVKHIDIIIIIVLFIICLKCSTVYLFIKSDKVVRVLIFWRAVERPYFDLCMDDSN